MERKYNQLGLDERIEIYRLRDIAKSLGRNVSTISRELKRNGKDSKKWPGGYAPQRAQELTRRRHARGRAYLLESQSELRKKIIDCLESGWSPEQISARMKREQSGDQISHESIYRYIYWRSWSFKENLHQLLPRKKGRRGRCKRNNKFAKTSILQRVLIHERPPEISARAHRRFGG